MGFQPALVVPSAKDVGLRYVHSHIAMHMEISALPSWVPEVIVAAVGSVLAYILAIHKSASNLEKQLALLEQRVGSQAETDKGIASDLKTAISTMQRIATHVEVASAEQAVVNKVTAETLNALVNKVELHQRQMSEHSQQLLLLREVITGPCRPSKSCWRPEDHTE